MEDLRLFPHFNFKTVHLFKVTGCRSSYFPIQGQIWRLQEKDRLHSLISDYTGWLDGSIHLIHLLYSFTFSNSLTLVRVTVDLGTSWQHRVQGRNSPCIRHQSILGNLAAFPKSTYLAVFLAIFCEMEPVIKVGHKMLCVGASKSHDGQRMLDWTKRW